MSAYSVGKQIIPAPKGPKASAPREDLLDVMLDRMADLVVDHIIDLKGRGVDPRRGTGEYPRSDVDTNVPARKGTMDQRSEDG